jgi:hypothetical protein
MKWQRWRPAGYVGENASNRNSLVARLNYGNTLQRK